MGNLVLVLPIELEQRFTETVEHDKKKQKMRYVTSFERIGIQKGKQQGMIETAREAILDVLRVRFAQLQRRFRRWTTMTC